MLRLILFIIVGIFVAVGVLAVALYHFLGWKGLVLFPFIIFAFLWLAKFIIKNIFRKIALSLVGIKARALRGATMSVHSIKSITRPPEIDDNDGDAPGNAVAKVVEPQERKDYVEMDVTITPKPNAANSFWEPAELTLTSEKIRSIADMDEKQVATIHSIEVWDGSVFGPDDSDKYPGEQRLKIVWEVNPGLNSVWLYYYTESIGRVELPVGTIEV